MPHDITHVHVRKILDSCELYERGQITLGVLLVNARDAASGLEGDDAERMSGFLDDLQWASEIPEERQRFAATNATREIRKHLTRIRR